MEIYTHKKQTYEGRENNQMTPYAVLLKLEVHIHAYAYIKQKEHSK